jgi:1,4-dihydroxy-2-naphthoate octaprenyltransferase
MPDLKTWWRATRPFAFTVSVIPPILGSIIAVMESPEINFNWFYFIIALIGSVSIHASSNMFNDYFDYKKNVDREGTYGSSGLLVEKVLTPKTLFTGAIILFLLSMLIGLYFLMILPNKITFLLILLTGGFLGFFYTAGPISLKYKALGDIAVFIAFGPAMVLGAYFIQTHVFSWTPILYALPIAFIVVAILHGNNIRDMENDRVANIKTIAIKLGLNKAKIIYYSLIILSYLTVLSLILFYNLPFFTLIILFSAPIALKLINLVKNKEKSDEKQFAMIDAFTSQFHMIFSILFIVGILIKLYI